MSGKDIQEKIKEIEEQLNVKVIYCIKSGSKLYGTDSEASDTDYLGIFVPTAEDVILKKDAEHYSTSTGANDSKNSKDDIDISLWSVYKFLNLVKKGETGALDLLFSLKAEHFHEICEVYVNKDMKHIENEFENLKSKQLRAFVGYCLGQAKKYNIKGARYAELKDLIDTYVTPYRVTAEVKVVDNLVNLKKVIKSKKYKYIKFVMAPGPRGAGDYKEVEYLEVLGTKHMLNIKESELSTRLNKMLGSFGDRTKASAEGIDKKALSHALRVISECQEFLETGSISFPLIEKELVRSIKYEEIVLEDVMQDLEARLDSVHRLLETSKLPEKVPQVVLDRIIKRTVK